MSELTRVGRSKSLSAAVKNFSDVPISVAVGLALIALLLLAAVLAPVIAPYGPNELDFMAQLKGPSFNHPFGTDANGRDVFSRCLYGLRLDLMIVVFITYVPLPVGILLGATGAYFGGWLDTAVARLTDVMISFPFIVLVIAIMAIVGPGILGVLIGVPIVAWALYARVARAEMLVIRELTYIEAARALGFSEARILFLHAIPNLLRTSFMFSTVDLVGNLLLLAGLSYLGLGAQPPTPELGAIIAEGQAYLLTGWWVATMPGLMLVVFGIGVAMIAEGLSDGTGRSIV